MTTRNALTASNRAEFFFKGYYHHWDSFWSERHNLQATPGQERVISDREFWGFKEEYTTRHQRGFIDESPTPFLVHNLGMPRTFHLAYSFSY